jgi:hypothetical protein
MTHHNETHSRGAQTPKRVFVGRARVLSEERRGELLENGYLT